MRTVNICGLEYTVRLCKDEFDIDTHFGQIDFKNCEIKLNKDTSYEVQEESLCHEIVHGILVHLGYYEQSQDEQFVQALGNAIYQTFVAHGEE